MTTSEDEANEVDAMEEAALKKEMKKMKKRQRKPQVVVRTEKRISKKFDGEKPSKFAEWLNTANAAISTRDDDEKLDMIVGALEGKALREVQRHMVADRNSAKKILNILQTKYADRRSSAQVRREYYSISQGLSSIIDFSDQLVECLEGTETKLGTDARGLEKMLIEQFVENVADPTLSWELKRDTTKNFDDLRSLALEFEAGRKTTSKVKTRTDEQSVSSMTKLTEAVEKLSTQVGDISKRLQTVESRVNYSSNYNYNRGRYNGGYRGGRGGYRGYGRGNDRGGYDRGGYDRGGDDRGGYDRGGYDRGYQNQRGHEADQQQQQTDSLNARAQEFVPSNSANNKGMPAQGQDQRQQKSEN